MGGRGSSSMTSKSPAQFFLSAIVKKYDQKPPQSYRSQQNYKYAKIALDLVNSGRAGVDVINSRPMLLIGQAIGYADYYSGGWSVSETQLRNLLGPSGENRPLGISEVSWDTAQQRAREGFAGMRELGYTDEETMALIIFDRTVRLG